MDLKKQSDNTLTVHQIDNPIFTAEDILIQQAKKLYDQHIAPSTSRVYKSDWNIFKTWCQAKNIVPENASP